MIQNSRRSDLLEKHCESVEGEIFPFPILSSKFNLLGEVTLLKEMPLSTTSQHKAPPNFNVESVFVSGKV
jgi:hypothetical protein